MLIYLKENPVIASLEKVKTTKSSGKFLKLEIRFQKPAKTNGVSGGPSHVTSDDNT